MERQLKQAGALDSGLASRLHEAQQLLHDALTPEMRDQLSRLDQSADSLRGGDTRQSLTDLAQQQQRLRDQLDRSLNVLKRAALEGAMQTLRDEAHDIAKQEKARANTSPAPPHDARRRPRERPPPRGHRTARAHAQRPASPIAQASARAANHETQRSSRPPRPGLPQSRSNHHHSNRQGSRDRSSPRKPRPSRRANKQTNKQTNKRSQQSQTSQQSQQERRQTAQSDAQQSSPSQQGTTASVAGSTGPAFPLAVA